MINFSTEFPVDTRNSVEDVVRLACTWVAGSPYTKIPSSTFEKLPMDEETTHHAGGQCVSIGIAKLPEFEIGGLSYVHGDGGLEWSTSIVTLRTANEHLLSIQVACEALNTAVRLPTPKKPYIVRQALEKLGGGMDGQVPVADQPFRLNDGEAGIAAALMLGTARNRLPIIYVSAGFDGRHLVEPDELARWVSGMAHVIVEPSRQFSLALKTLTNARNVYGGTVGVYWPESSARKAYFLDTEAPDGRALRMEIAKDIRTALCNRRPTTNCTWAHVKETIARKQYELLKAKGSTELQAYIGAFDADQAAKDAKLLDAEREIARLNADLRRYSAASTDASGGLLARGEEQDLYEHEARDIVIEALEDAMRSAKQNGRREHVLASLLRANAASRERQRLAEEIKGLLKTYRDMDTRTRNALAKLGFDITDDGKHYKAIFQGDGRYTFILPKTSGDSRAGKNVTSNIVSTLF